jgi:hypothetical protein
MNEDTATYNLMTYIVHITEARKYYKFLSKEKQLLPEYKAEMRKIDNNCNPLLNLVHNRLNMDVHEEIGSAYDDFARLMIKYPHHRDFIMTALYIIVDKLEKKEPINL